MGLPNRHSGRLPHGLTCYLERVPVPSSNSSSPFLFPFKYIRRAVIWRGYRYPPQITGRGAATCYLARVPVPSPNSRFLARPGGHLDRSLCLRSPAASLDLDSQWRRKISSQQETVTSPPRLNTAKPQIRSAHDAKHPTGAAADWGGGARTFFFEGKAHNRNQSKEGTD